MSNPTATIRITESASQFINQLNTGSQSIAETINSPNIEDTLSISANATLGISENIAETITNTMTTTITISEVISGGDGAYGAGAYGSGPYGDA